MPHHNVNPSTLATPVGFSHATVVPPGSTTVHLGGQTAMDTDGRIVPGGIVEQFTQAFGNVLTALAAAGGAPGDLVSVTIYLTDVPDYQSHGSEIGRIWRAMAGTQYPAMAGIGITRLWQPEALIEISAVAVIDPEPHG